ncbi:MAG TPA: preprotein translocase subunit SecG [Pyrinomonadaceae bacterium]|nr:preprotein translocase subunit SecG [Pyrinomonadaceae bacterium]
MIYILYTLFILACIVLVISVLLQPGKADAGALFTSSISSTAFGPRGTQTILAKITIGAAIAFMLIALLLGMGVGSQRSLMEDTKAKPTPAASPAGAAAPAQTGASPAATTQTDGGATAPAGAPATTAASPESKASPSK